jgi:uncharacterized protein YbbK (DUF523 family)
MVERILVSKCLLGENCRYDGKDAFNLELFSCLKDYQVIAVCPEELGGLKGLRGPFELTGSAQDVLELKAEVVDETGHTATKQFLKGAFKTLHLAQKNKVKIAVLAERSPSCSNCGVYDGSFTHTLNPGLGITAMLLDIYGVEVMTPQEFIQNQRTRALSAGQEKTKNE